MEEKRMVLNQRLGIKQTNSVYYNSPRKIKEGILRVPEQESPGEMVRK
jgi:hypothetical protein